MPMALESTACNVATRSDEGTVQVQNGAQTQDSIIPMLTFSESSDSFPRSPCARKPGEIILGLCYGAGELSRWFSAHSNISNPKNLSCLNSFGHSRSKSLSLKLLEEILATMMCEGPLVLKLQIMTRLQEESKSAKFRSFRSMYSSVVGGITTDVAAMVIPLDDHMVHRGHSVFDTAVLINGYLYELDAHLDRFLRSVAKAKITPPVDRAAMREILLQTVAAAHCRDGFLRYWLSCGRGGFDLSAKECDQATFYAIVLDENHFNDNVECGVKVITTSVPIKPRDFAIMKSTNYLPNALVLKEAEERGAFAGIWLDDEGFIAECQNMNVAFVSKDGNLLVPSFDKILSGCTAQRILELVPQLIREGAVPGLNGVEMKKISLEEAKDATEMMLIGSGVMITPVVEWDDKPVGNGKSGPITLALRQFARHDMMEGPAAIRTEVNPKI